jgi:hypothetical protein
VTTNEAVDEAIAREFQLEWVTFEKYQ